MDADTWTVAEAKAKLSEVIERAQNEGPQRLPAMNAVRWSSLTPTNGNAETADHSTLAEFFAAS